MDSHCSTHHDGSSVETIQDPVRYLEAARDLNPPMPVATVSAEMEGHEFWEQNNTLLCRAWKEYGCLHPEVYKFQEHSLHPSFLSLVRQAQLGQIVDVSALASQLHAGGNANGVYGLQVFTAAFETKLLEEVEHLNASGIPTRRPNGMNRTGLILSDLGFQDLFAPLMRDYIAPLASLLFPEWVSASGDECAEVYAFTVQYQEGQDLALAEHFDTSNLTLNICLGKDFKGGNLVFGRFRHDKSHFNPAGTSEAPCKSLVEQKIHRALLHLGGHRHAALPVEHGCRINLIVWATCRHGVVRIRPRSWHPPF